jgi:outer membrane protein TolC
VSFDGVRESFIQGDKAGIDTLEAYIQVQNRQITQFDAQRKLREKALKVSNYLWFENSVPLQLDPDVVPQPFNDQMIDLAMLDTMSSQIEQLQNTHPILRQFQFNVQQQEVNQRLKASKLIPTIKLNYNFITEQGPFQGESIEQTGFSTQDYKFGVDVKFPLLLREGRGAWQEARIKRESAELKLDQKTVEILNKARAYQNELTYLHEQLLVYRSAIKNYQRMLDAEVRKFFNGESSIFLINSREVKLVEAQVKLNKTEAEYEKAKAGFYHALGTLSQQ